MSETPKTHPWSHPVRIADLATRHPTRFDLSPSAETLAIIADALGISAIKKLRFSGELRPLGRRDWYLDAKLGATVVQPCVVTLDPVTTRLDEPVLRTYLAEMPDYEAGSEVEMPEDDTSEPLPETVDLGDVMLEALAIALPQYPRAEGVSLGQAVFTQPGQTPMKDEDTLPFAGLKSLRDKLGKTDD